MTDEYVDPVGPINKKPTKSFSRGQLRRFLGLLMVLLFVLAVIAMSIHTQKRNHSLQKTLQVLQSKVIKQETDLLSLNNELTTVIQTEQSLQNRLMEQESQLSSLRSSYQAGAEKWSLEEAKSLVIIANNQLQFLQNTSLALLLLEEANQIIQRLYDPKLNPLHEGLVADIAALKGMSQIDTTAQLTQLMALKQQLSQLPFAPVMRDNTTETAVPHETKKLSWWRAGLERSWQALRKIVIVHYNPSNVLPLMMPEEKSFLLLNLNGQIDNAIWSVLHHNALIYQASLNYLIAWVEKYFDQEDLITKTFLQNAQALRSLSLQATVPTLTSPALFDRANRKLTTDQNTEEQSLP